MTFVNWCVPSLAKSPLPPVSKWELNPQAIYHRRSGVRILCDLIKGRVALSPLTDREQHVSGGQRP